MAALIVLSCRPARFNHEPAVFLLISEYINPARGDYRVCVAADMVSMVQSDAMRLILEFLRDEQGQDLVEYTLVVAGLVVLFAALASFNHEPIVEIWDKGNEVLQQADEKAS